MVSEFLRLRSITATLPYLEGTTFKHFSQMSPNIREERVWSRVILFQFAVKAHLKGQLNWRNCNVCNGKKCYIKEAHTVILICMSISLLVPRIDPSSCWNDNFLSYYVQAGAMTRKAPFFWNLKETCSDQANGCWFYSVSSCCPFPPSDPIRKTI